MTEATETEDPDLEGAEEALLKTAETPEDEKTVLEAGRTKTTVEDRAWIREEVGEGRMSPGACAARFGVSPQYISKLLRLANIRFGSKKEEREKAEAEVAAKAKMAAEITFASRKAHFAEEHRMQMLAQFRMARQIEGIRQKRWLEAAAGGSPLPVPKESMNSARVMALIDQRVRILLDLDNDVIVEDLPQIDIHYMGDEEISQIRQGEINTDELVTLEEDVVTT